MVLRNKAKRELRSGFRPLDPQLRRLPSLSQQIQLSRGNALSGWAILRESLCACALLPHCALPHTVKAVPEAVTEEGTGDMEAATCMCTAFGREQRARV